MIKENKSEIIPIKIPGFRNSQGEIIVYSEVLQRALKPIGGTMKLARWTGHTGIHHRMSTSDLLAIPELSGAYLYALPLKHWVRILDADERLIITLTETREDARGYLSIKCNGAQARFNFVFIADWMRDGIFRRGKNKIARLDLPRQSLQYILSCNT